MTKEEIIEELEDYLDELDGPDDCKLIPVGSVIDRICDIIYGEERIIQVREEDQRVVDITRAQCPAGFLCIHEVLCQGARR